MKWVFPILIILEDVLRNTLESVILNTYKIQLFFQNLLTEDGRQLKIFGIKRTMKSAVSTIIEHWKDLCLDARHILYVVHANVPEEAKQIAERIREAFPLTEIQIHPLSPVFVTQGGPACVALQYIEK